jgi:hypothetical protein
MSWIFEVFGGEVCMFCPQENEGEKEEEVLTTFSQACANAE